MMYKFKSVEGIYQVADTSNKNAMLDSTYLELKNGLIITILNGHGAYADDKTFEVGIRTKEDIELKQFNSGSYLEKYTSEEFEHYFGCDVLSYVTEKELDTILFLLKQVEVK